MIYQILFFPLLSFIYLGSCLEVLVIHCYQTRKPVKRKLLLFRPQPFEPFEDIGELVAQPRGLVEVRH